MRRSGKWGDRGWKKSGRKNPPEKKSGSRSGAQSFNRRRLCKVTHDAALRTAFILEQQASCGGIAA